MEDQRTKFKKCVYSWEVRAQLKSLFGMVPLLDMEISSIET